MCLFIWVRKADELGINFWLRLLAVGLLISLLFQSGYYFSAINREQPVKLPALLSSSEDAEKSRNEVALANQVHSAIAQTKRLYMLSIAVKNRAGVITLRGEVPSEIDRDLAGNVAREVPGVQEVQNEIQIVARLKQGSEMPVQTPVAANVEDLELEANVREALQSIPALKNQALQIKVQQRNVTLTGRVASEQLRQQAEQAIRHTPKVNSLNNRLVIGH